MGVWNWVEERGGEGVQDAVVIVWLVNCFPGDMVTVVVNTLLPWLFFFVGE